MSTWRSCLTNSRFASNLSLNTGATVTFLTEKDKSKSRAANVISTDNHIELSVKFSTFHSPTRPKSLCWLLVRGPGPWPLIVWLRNADPANTQRNKYVIMTSKRSFDVIITCLLRCVLSWDHTEMTKSLGTVRCGHAPFICSLSFLYLGTSWFIYEWEGGQKVKQAHHTSVPGDCAKWSIYNEKFGTKWLYSDYCAECWLTICVCN